MLNLMHPMTAIYIFPMTYLLGIGAMEHRIPFNAVVVKAHFTIKIEVPIRVSIGVLSPCMYLGFQKSLQLTGVIIGEILPLLLVFYDRNRLCHALRRGQH